MSSQTPEQKKFERVYEVKTPGYFFFVFDPENHSIEILPSGKSRSDFIIGANPGLDYFLLRYLKQSLRISHTYRKDTDNRTLSTPVLNPKHWNGESGLLQIDLQYALLLQSYPVEGNQGSTVQIIDQGQPTIKDSRLYITEPEDIDGRFRLEIDAFHFQEPLNISYWRGRLRLSGQKPGVLISASIDYLNQQISEHKIPVWRVINHQFDPSVGPNWPF